MTDGDLRMAMERHGVGSAELARLTGVTTRQVANWRTGHAVVPSYVVTIFDLMEGRLPTAPLDEGAT
jgi:transcriptional regulator with XRE-family HTH domain